MTQQTTQIVNKYKKINQTSLFSVVKKQNSKTLLKPRLTIVKGAETSLKPEGPCLLLSGLRQSAAGCCLSVLRLYSLTTDQWQSRDYRSHSSSPLSHLKLNSVEIKPDVEPGKSVLLLPTRAEEAGSSKHSLSV